MTTPRHLPRGWIVLGAILLVWLVVDRPCTVCPTGHRTAAASFDAVTYVDRIRASRVVPEIDANAVGVEFFRPAATTNPAGVGAGAAAVEGRVVSIDTTWRVGMALVGEWGVAVYPHPSLVIVVTLVASMMIGAVNGLLAARLRVAPFIATLGVRRAGWPML